ncbi:CubicO group peptidase, beta-lactamase class C family [Rhizobiales bacterium GAS191]|nr:CubicO group peptidase, beta-lactamase class C family [Rhizobiales bacterium GAS191]
MSADDSKFETMGPIGTFVLAREVDYLSTPPAQRAFVFRHMDEVEHNPTRQVRHGDFLRELSTGTPIDIDVVIDGNRENIDSFMDRYGLAALIVVKDGKVRAERYKFGNMPSSRMVVQSVTKSVASTALGIAIYNGKIASLDDTISKYVPELNGTAYGAVTIRAIANMTSGVRPPHGPAPSNPLEDTLRVAYYDTDKNAVLRWLATHETYAEPGAAYEYTDINYYVVSFVVTRAVCMPLAQYISEKIWKPAGMEHDAFMRTTHAGQEDGHGGMAMTLRDMARFGMFVMDAVKGERGPDVPADWFATISRAQTSSTGVRAPGAIDLAPDFGYELGWWTLPRGRDYYELGDDGSFAALGYYGQAIYIVPGQNTIIALQSANTYHNPELFLREKKLTTAIVLGLKENDRESLQCISCHA